MRGTQEEMQKQGVRRELELAMITDKFSFQPRKARDIAKHENCHCKRATEK